MNDNELRFRILFSLYSRKYSTFHNYHFLQNLLGDAKLGGEDVNKVQIFIERMNEEGRVKFKKNESARHYLGDIEITIDGIGSVERLMNNTFDDPSPLTLTPEEEKVFEEIKNESNDAKKANRFCDFILEKKHHFFETDVFG